MMSQRELKQELTIKAWGPPLEEQFFEKLEEQANKRKNKKQI